MWGLNLKLEPILICPDTHVPFHDERAWNLFLKVGKTLKPKHLVVIGDLADFYSVSSHSKSPDRTSNLEWEVGEVNAALDQLDGLGATKKYFIAGNHCLTTDHRVLTKFGWRTVDQISVGDLIATRASGGTLAWQPIQHITRRPITPDEHLYVMQTQGISVACTNKHNIVGKSNGVTWRRPAEECPDTFDLPVSVASGLPDYPLTDAQIRLAAWASTDVHYASKHAGVTLYQSQTGKEKVLEQDLEDVGIPFTRRVRMRDTKIVAGKVLKVPSKPSIEYTFAAREGREIRELTGMDKKGNLPPWVMSLSDRQWEIFVDRLILADGSKATKGQKAFVFNGKLPICEAVQAAAVVHGWRASISEYRPGQFRVNLVQSSMHIRVAGWKTATVKTVGTEVWCPTVENGNFLTERDRKVCVTGNCDRLTRYLQDKAPALFGTVSIPTLFNLKERGWVYTPYKDHTKIGKLRLTHDVGTAGRYAVHKALDTYQHSIVTGHTHRLGYLVEGNAEGEHKLSASFGWLGDASKIDYMARCNVNKNWALGFGFGYTNHTTGIAYLSPVPIIVVDDVYSCVVNGQYYEG